MPLHIHPKSSGDFSNTMLSENGATGRRILPRTTGSIMPKAKVKRTQMNALFFAHGIFAVTLKDEERGRHQHCFGMHDRP